MKGRSFQRQIMKIGRKCNESKGDGISFVLLLSLQPGNASQRDSLAAPMAGFCAAADHKQSRMKSGDEGAKEGNTRTW